MQRQDPRIDDYISKAATFAQPVLFHIRRLIHDNCPEVEETIKWGFPHFLYCGEILCHMAAFKKHCTFGFWKASIMSDPHNLLQSVGKTAMGHMGQITNVSDLPTDAVLGEYIKEASRLNREGVKLPAKARTEAITHSNLDDDILFALRENPAANSTFENFSPSCKKEYIEWITGAKTETTRNSRLQTAIGWMAEGKIRN